MNVLLVDDDPEIRMITTFLLEQGGHSVREAANPSEARAAFAAARPDVVLMDVMLDEADGIALADELFVTAGTGLRLVFLTGATRPEQRALMLATPALGILQKPFDPSTFLQSLHQIVGE
jgi:CheY-like chemotaxis protein